MKFLFFGNRKSQSRNAHQLANSQVPRDSRPLDPDDQILDENISKLGFGFYSLKPTLKRAQRSPEKPLPPLDKNVEAWLDQLIAERRLNSNIISSTVKLVTSSETDQQKSSMNSDTSDSSEQKRSLIGENSDNSRSLAENHNLPCDENCAEKVNRKSKLQKSTRVIKTAETAKARDEEALKKSKPVIGTKKSVNSRSVNSKKVSKKISK